MELRNLEPQNFATVGALWHRYEGFLRDILAAVDLHDLVARSVGLKEERCTTPA